MKPIRCCLGACLWGSLGFFGSVAYAAELVGSGALAGSSMQVKSDTEIRYHHVPEKSENFEDRNIHDYDYTGSAVVMTLTTAGPRYS